MKGIPPVKTWIITLEDGRKFDVLAPTKRLTVLNLRFENYGTWGTKIKSVGLKRKP